jgi:hypothetical protein
MRNAIGGAAAMGLVVTIGLALARGGTRADAPTRAAVVEPNASELSIRLVGNAGVALDHFAAELFLTRADWRVIGPPSATAALPPDRVVTGDSTSIGAFAVVALRSPHTDDHRSYRVRWRGRVLHFPGDTEDPTSVPSEPRLDMRFVTPWLSCSLTDQAVLGARIVAYRLQPDGTDRLCGAAEVHEQGAELSLTPRAS